MGKRYTIFNNELASKITTTNNYFASYAPRIKCHLLITPPVGGRPITLNAPIRKAAMV